MPIITIASTKGGVGKSTVAVNLAAQLSRMNIPVSLIDSDPQGSVAKWSMVRDSMISQGSNLTPISWANVQKEELLALALKKSERGDVVIIDSAGVDSTGTRSAFLRADLIITLSAPSTLDLWELDTLVKLVIELEKRQNREIPVLLLFNKVKPIRNSKSMQDALDYIKENAIALAHVFSSNIKDRVIYQQTFNEGKGVVEYMPANQDARKEILAVVEELIEVTGLSAQS